MALVGPSSFLSVRLPSGGSTAFELFGCAVKDLPLHQKPRPHDALIRHAQPIHEVLRPPPRHGDGRAQALKAREASVRISESRSWPNSSE